MGLAKGSIYTYVESKEALFDCVLRHADRAGAIGLPERLPVAVHRHWGPSPRPVADEAAKRIVLDFVLRALLPAA